MPSMLTQMNLSEDEIREVNYKRYRENKPVIQKRLYAVYIKATTSLSNFRQLFPDSPGVFLQVRRHIKGHNPSTCIIRVAKKEKRRPVKETERESPFEGFKNSWKNRE
jgi:hypothetical protein